MCDVYLPSLDKYNYHVHCVQILSKNLCGRLRDDTSYSDPGNMYTIRYYAEKMSTNFNLEVNTEHFRIGRNFLNKGYNIEIVDRELNSIWELYSHFLDDSRQDNSTTHAHTISMLEELKNNNQLKDRCTIWKSTDGGCKQYRYGGDLFLNRLFLLTLILPLIV